MMTPLQIARLMQAMVVAIAWFTLVQSSSAQPNVILMMGDDHGWEETGYNGHPHVKTPVLDEMAATGLKFQRFYAAHSSCSPTRASFLTGRHPNRMGTFSPGWSLRPEEKTIAHLASAAGYHCAHFGKWHVGAVKKESPVSPLAMGFHECLSHDNFFEMNPSLSRNGEAPQRIEGESSDILIQEAIQSIKRAQAAGKPFFQVVWFGSPHEPYSGLPEDLALYDDLPAKYLKPVKLTSNETGGAVTRPQGEVLRERYAEITAMDRAIGKLRSYLSNNQLRDNTLLFYCGDNGTSADAVIASPHRAMKGSIYEGGTLVPGLVEWPARIKSPVVSPVRASTSDLLPTLAALMSQPLPERPLDGIDLTPLLKNAAAQRPSPLYFWQFEKKKTALGEPYVDPALQEGITPLVKLAGGKATRDFTNFHHPIITESDYLGSRSIIEGRHKLIIQHVKAGKAKFELYDLDADPSEKRDVAKEHPELVASLRSKLRQWQTSVLNSLTGGDYQP
jgi:arylsulfatase A-like enzyme